MCSSADRFDGFVAAFGDAQTPLWSDSRAKRNKAMLVGGCSLRDSGSQITLELRYSRYGPLCKCCA